MYRGAFLCITLSTPLLVCCYTVSIMIQLKCCRTHSGNRKGVCSWKLLYPFWFPLRLVWLATTSANGQTETTVTTSLKKAPELRPLGLLLCVPLGYNFFLSCCYYSICTSQKQVFPFFMKTFIHYKHNTYPLYQFILFKLLFTLSQGYSDILYANIIAISSHFIQ